MSRDAKNSLFVLAFVLTLFTVIYFTWDTKVWVFVSAITAVMFELARRYVVGQTDNEGVTKDG